MSPTVTMGACYQNFRADSKSLMGVRHTARQARLGAARINRNGRPPGSARLLLRPGSRAGDGLIPAAQKPLSRGARDGGNELAFQGPVGSKLLPIAPVTRRQ